MTNSTRVAQKPRHKCRFRPGPKALQEIRKYKQSCTQLVHKVPYKHLLREIAPHLKDICDDDSKAVKTLHEASQAYLTGLFGSNQVNMCRAKEESTSFLLSMAWIGFKKMITVLSRDKQLKKKIQSQEEFEFLQISRHNHPHHHHHHHHVHDHDAAGEHSQQMQPSLSEQNIIDMMDNTFESMIASQHLQEDHHGGDLQQQHGPDEDESMSLSENVDEQSISDVGDLDEAQNRPSSTNSGPGSHPGQTEHPTSSISAREGPDVPGPDGAPLVKCTNCRGIVEETQFVQCPSNIAHKFCFSCCRESIIKQGNEAFCPSGDKCPHEDSIVPWAFMQEEMREILGPDAAPLLDCTNCRGKIEDKDDFVQCPSNVAHKFCFSCCRESIIRQGNDPFCPSGEKCLLQNSNLPWAFMQEEIDSILGGKPEASQEKK